MLGYHLYLMNELNNLRTVMSPQMNGRTGRWRFAESHTAGPQRGVCKMPSCQCPSGWTEWDRRCYKAIRQPLSWLEARNRCRRMADNADLVSIINQRENNFVHGE